jgi:hypothetical protein
MGRPVLWGGGAPPPPPPPPGGGGGGGGPRAPPRAPLHPAERGRRTAIKSPLHRMERGFRGEVYTSTATQIASSTRLRYRFDAWNTRIACPPV